MHIIEVFTLPNGGHRNQQGSFSYVPAGWARVPEGMKIPDTYPFVEVETAEVGGITVVTTFNPSKIL